MADFRYYIVVFWDHLEDITTEHSRALSIVSGYVRYDLCSWLFTRDNPFQNTFLNLYCHNDLNFSKGTYSLKVLFVFWSTTLYSSSKLEFSNMLHLHFRSFLIRYGKCLCPFLWYKKNTTKLLSRFRLLLDYVRPT